MQEGALTLAPDGTALYANQRFASFLGLALPDIVGQKLGQFITTDDRGVAYAIWKNNCTKILICPWLPIHNFKLMLNVEQPGTNRGGQQHNLQTAGKNDQRPQCQQ